ncbi:MAG: replication initiator protein A [Lachnospiraceae bacterium]|nr:replication initiator protein A [Lachnospiraceae bacterium]
MQEIQFDYFRGMEAEQYSFYRIPKLLFTSDYFKGISCEAKVLYGLMLDRMSLSVKNRWFDEEDRVYIIFTVEDVMELLNCGRQKAVRTLAELDVQKGIGLIEKRRVGLGHPNVIYVKNFMVKQTSEEEKAPENAENSKKYENHTSGSMKSESSEVRKSYFRKCEKRNSGSMNSELPEVPKSNGNKTDINETELNETDSLILSNLSDTCSSMAGEVQDMMERMNQYRALVRKNIDYECLLGDPGCEKEAVDELVELIVDVLMMPDDAPVRIAQTEKPAAVVKDHFLKLTCEHIRYVLTCLAENTGRVGNIKAYLLTVLYNAVLTIGNYYQARVNYDMYGAARGSDAQRRTLRYRDTKLEGMSGVADAETENFVTPCHKVEGAG